MRKENEAIKKKLTGQIQDLRRQVVTKQAFDKGELQKEITTTKRELSFASKKLAYQRMGKSASQTDTGQNVELERSIRVLETVQVAKLALEDQNESLKRRVEYLENSQIDMGAASRGAMRIPDRRLNMSGEDESDSQDN